MEISRNQYCTVGLIILFLGIQFRAVEGFTLKNEAREIIHAKLHPDNPLAASAIPSRVKHPEWLGWSLVSVGAVLTLASLALKK